MGDIHRLLKEQGKEAALKSDFARDVIEAAAGYLASEDTEIGFLYSGWAQSALPHRRLPDGQHGKFSRASHAHCLSWSSPWP